MLTLVSETAAAGSSMVASTNILSAADTLSATASMYLPNFEATAASQFGFGLLDTAAAYLPTTVPIIADVATSGAQAAAAAAAVGAGLGIISSSTAAAMTDKADKLKVLATASAKDIKQADNLRGETGIDAEDKLLIAGPNVFNAILPSELGKTLQSVGSDTKMTNGAFEVAQKVTDTMKVLANSDLTNNLKNLMSVIL